MAGAPKQSNGQSQDSMLDAMAPALGSFHLGQRLTMEAVQFWARRMRAYADQMEALVKCEDASQFWTTQQGFLNRLRDDYASEGEAVRKIVETSSEETQRQASA